MPETENSLSERAFELVDVGDVVRGYLESHDPAKPAQYLRDHPDQVRSLYQAIKAECERLHKDDYLDQIVEISERLAASSN